MPPRPTALQRWQLEFERLPIGIQDQVELQPFFPQFRAERHAMRIVAPVWLKKLDVMS
jgi:hypothetical protein